MYRAGKHLTTSKVTLIYSAGHLAGIALTIDIIARNIYALTITNTISAAPEKVAERAHSFG